METDSEKDALWQLFLVLTLVEGEVGREGRIKGGRVVWCGVRVTLTSESGRN
jgi:hypothetical protein